MYIGLYINNEMLILPDENLPFLKNKTVISPAHHENF